MDAKKWLVGCLFLMSGAVLYAFVAIMQHVQTEREARAAALVAAQEVVLEKAVVYERSEGVEEFLTDRVGADINNGTLCLTGEQEVFSCQVRNEGVRLPESVSVCVCTTCESTEVVEDESGDVVEQGAGSSSMGVLVFRGGVAPFASSAGRVSLVWEGESLFGFELMGSGTKSLSMSAIRWEGTPKDAVITSDRGVLSCADGGARVDFRRLLDFKED